MSILCPPMLLPELSAATQAFLRAGYGVLLIGTLLLALRNGRRFFLSERWGGYAKSSFAVDALHNPVALPLVMLAWLGGALLLTCGIAPVWTAALNLALCYYFFIWMRWRGVLRGMGAPGFMTYWLAVAVFLLELTLHHAPAARPLALLVLQVDFALIMLSAGLYKLSAGYLRNHGMELGMVNPQWGYWYRLWSNLSPRSPVFFFFNQSAWLTEVLAAALMLWPTTRFIGAMLIVLSFVFIATQIRLGLLCAMVMTCGLIFFAPGTIGAAVVDACSSAPAAPTHAGSALIEWVVGLALAAYLTLLPIAHGGLSYNFYGRRALPGLAQRALEWYTNLFGIIIWRVFSADHTDFFLRIHTQRCDGGQRVLFSHYDRVGGRFNHVGEAITVTSVFTSLKYYPSDDGIFRERLLRYARTLPCPPNAVLVFEYVSVRKAGTRFEYVPVTEFIVDLATSQITEQPLADPLCARSASRVSPVHATARPGSYVRVGG